MVRKQRKPIVWIAAGSVVGVLLAFLLTSPLWFARFARAVLPDRYVVAYAPQFVQDIIFDSSGVEALPTAAVSEDEILDLLAGLENATATLPASAANDDQAPEETIIEQPTQTPEPTATGTPYPISEGQFLSGFRHEYQGWNRCGPATLATMLSYFGSEDTQNDIAEQIKPADDDRNVRPDELVAYARQAGYGAFYRINGDLELMQRLLSAGYPVLVERGFDEEPEKDWMGHYMLLYGFSAGDREFYAHDSYFGPDQVWDFNRFDELWRHFNRTYVVVYNPGDSADVAAIIGPDMDNQTMYERALVRANEEVDTYDDAFAWYNLGAVLTELENYQGAEVAFDVARERILPWRMYWYRFELYEAYYQTQRYSDLVTLAEATIAYYPDSEEGHYYVGLTYLAQGQTRQARTSLNRALNINPSYEPAAQALQQLSN